MKIENLNAKTIEEYIDFKLSLIYRNDYKINFIILGLNILNKLRKDSLFLTIETDGKIKYKFIDVCVNYLDENLIMIGNMEDCKKDILEWRMKLKQDISGNNIYYNELGVIK